MDVTFYHKNLSPKQQKVLSNYVQEKLPSIENLLTKFAPDAALLKISAEKFEKHDAFEIEFCLNLPMKTLVANEKSHTIEKAVDLSKDRLITQIKKQMALLRKERGHKSIRKTEQLNMSLLKTKHF